MTSTNPSSILNRARTALIAAAALALAGCSSISGLIDAHGRELLAGEDVVLDNHILVDVYGHVAVDMAALVAAAIDVTLKDASVIVFCGIVRSGTHKVIFIDIPDSCVPLQYLTLFGQLVYFVGGTKVNFF